MNEANILLLLATGVYVTPCNDSDFRYCGTRQKVGNIASSQLDMLNRSHK